MAINIKQIIKEELVHHKLNEHINRAKESVNEAKFNFSEPAVRRAAALLAKAMEKVDGVKIKVHDFEWDEGKGAGFDLSWDGDKHDGGSYGISDKGEVINHAYPGKPVYGNIKSSARDFEKGIRKYSKKRNESVNEAVKPIKVSGNLKKDLKTVTDLAGKMVKYAKDNFNTYIPTGHMLSQLIVGGSKEKDVLKYNIDHLAKAINKDLKKRYMKDFVAESVNEAKLPKRFTVKTKQTLNDTTYNTGTYALKKKRGGGGIYLNMDNNQMLGVDAGDIAKLSEDTLDEMQVINKKTGKDVTKHMLAYMEGKITKEKFEKLTGLSKEKIKVSESSAEYAKSLQTIAKDRQLKMLSKKDKETLLKIADLMKRANEGTLDV